MSERIVNVKEQDYNGKHFRSTLEAQTAKALDGLGIPYKYEERKVELLPGFRSPFQKDKVRSITYTPDFIIGNIMLECKGFETPEWKLKKKLLFKWLLENEPQTLFYQIHDSRKSLLEMLDNHWEYLGYRILVGSRPVRGKVEEREYSSIKDAMVDLKLLGKPLGSLMGAFLGTKEFVFNYSWKLKKIENDDSERTE